MSFQPIYGGWDLVGKVGRLLKKAINGSALTAEASQISDLTREVANKQKQRGLQTEADFHHLANDIATDVVDTFVSVKTLVDAPPLHAHVAACVLEFITFEGLFLQPTSPDEIHASSRADLWDTEDALKMIGKQLDHFDEVVNDIVHLFTEAVRPLVKQCPTLLQVQSDDNNEMSYQTKAILVLDELPRILQDVVQLPFAPDFQEYDLTNQLRSRLEYNLVLASDGNPQDPQALERNLRFPQKSSITDPTELARCYLAGTPLASLFDVAVPIVIPQRTRFEHHHICAGSGHGKTQALQEFILHDLEAVARGEASIVVIDSQSDLIENIAGLEMFAPGQPLADRLCIIDPTDVEYPVALNLFDAGMDRINDYSQLQREKLINGVLELYDFVLGSLLDAGMTQKQSVIFRYITRLLLHIPNATIHTLRELLEDDGYDKYQEHIQKLQGTARSFFDTEFMSKEFVQTKKQVLRRLYGILENQSFERMFSHPKSKLDLFTEMNAGKVILINTAKDLLKENGTEILGRFFIAMIAQAAQERAVLKAHKRLPTFVYIDEANDYFDRTTGVILSQARKYNVGMILAHQFLGQLDAKLQEAVFSNTSVKFAGGVSAKDARTLASELRTDAAFIETQPKLSFAAFVNGQTKRAASLSITPGKMEKLPRMCSADRQQQRETMREKYAIHYTELNGHSGSGNEETVPSEAPDDDPPTAWD